MKPGDIIFWRDERYGHHRFWEIEGVHLGGEGHESLIEVRSLTEKTGSAHGARVGRTYVPEPMVRNLPIYTPDIRPAA
jgi:hypothetical protein